jgi:hypothetical protein
MRNPADHQFDLQYPRTYQMQRDVRIFYRGFGAFLLVFMVVMTSLRLNGVMVVGPPIALHDEVLGDTFFAVLCVFMIAVADRRVVLYEDAIEVKTWVATRKLMRSEIRGRRTGTNGRASYYIIVPVDNSARNLKLPPMLHLDKAFFAWMKAIPHIDR